MELEKIISALEHRLILAEDGLPKAMNTIESQKKSPDPMEQYRIEDAPLHDPRDAQRVAQQEPRNQIVDVQRADGILSWSKCSSRSEHMLVSERDTGS